MNLHKIRELVSCHRVHVLYGFDDETDLAWIRENGPALQELLEGALEYLMKEAKNPSITGMRQLHTTALGWGTPSVLRERGDAELIECQAVLSGRWKKLWDHYWDDCVIPVQYRLKEN